ncbi:MAG TPA: hypothetical protein VL500_02870 [Candidatus Eisenbacteria bacterium]|jgi:hypothetical protein|nr:hypothetical protein [Candidatus Eisenbacteria bacterium]
MTKTPKHTLVLHINPDLEACFMAHLLLTREELRDALGVVDVPSLKFIPGGPLRPEDWQGEKEVESKALEAAGYVFLDCGGGLFDQHGRPENLMRNSVSSLDLMAHVLELEARLPHLMPIVQIISDNDLYGEDVAPSHSVRKTTTPHTPRHLRDMILGWNILHADDPEITVALASNAFGCIERCIDATIEKPRDEVKHKDFFLFSVLQNGAVSHFKTQVGLDAEDEALRAAEWFVNECESGLLALEQEWMAGEKDYWSGTKLRTVQVAKKTADGVAFQTVTLAHGRSKSTRYGAVTRYGNAGDNSEKPRRNKADVTIQFSGDGKFIISTKGIVLDRVAQVIREADLRRRGVNVTKEDRALLDRSGHLKFTDTKGREQLALYFTEYRTAFGNAFRANPMAEKTPLKEEEIVELTVKALSAL